jgi:hypothetical protein
MVRFINLWFGSVIFDSVRFSLWFSMNSLSNSVSLGKKLQLLFRCSIFINLVAI